MAQLKCRIIELQSTSNVCVLHSDQYRVWLCSGSLSMSTYIRLIIAPCTHSSSSFLKHALNGNAIGSLSALIRIENVFVLHRIDDSRGYSLTLSLCTMRQCVVFIVGYKIQSLNSAIRTQTCDHDHSHGSGIQNI